MERRLFEIAHKVTKRNRVIMNRTPMALLQITLQEAAEEYER